jgi:hypothetical protein
MKKEKRTRCAVVLAGEEMMRVKVVFVAMMALFLSVIAAYAALSNKDANLIKIAFQNGYVAALRLDIEQIQKLKDDNATMQKAVEDASEKYLKRLQEMNK